MAPFVPTQRVSAYKLSELLPFSLSPFTLLSPTLSTKIPSRASYSTDSSGLLVFFFFYFFIVCVFSFLHQLMIFPEFHLDNRGYKLETIHIGFRLLITSLTFWIMKQNSVWNNWRGGMVTDATSTSGSMVTTTTAAAANSRLPFLGSWVKKPMRRERNDCGLLSFRSSYLLVALWPFWVRFLFILGENTALAQGEREVSQILRNAY